MWPNSDKPTIAARSAALKLCIWIYLAHMAENHCTNRHIHSPNKKKDEANCSIINIILPLYLYETLMCTIIYDCICLFKHSLQLSRWRKRIYISTGIFFFYIAFLYMRDRARQVCLKILIMYKCFALIRCVNPESQQKESSKQIFFLLI